MKIKQMFRWILENCRLSLLILYSILLVLYLFFSFLSVLLDGNFSSGSLSYSSSVMMLVLGITSFREGFRFSLANGVSRKSYYISFFLSMSAVSAVIALLDYLFTLVFSNFVNMDSELFAMLYPGSWETNNYLQNFVDNFVWMFLLCMFLTLLGFFIGGVYYRLTRPTRILVSIIVPAFLFLLLPALFILLPEGAQSSVLQALGQFGVFLLKSPYTMGGVFLGLAVVFGFFSWLLLRRAPIKG